LSYTFDKDIGKMNQNNGNVQWISMETREEDGNKINIVTIGGIKTRLDAENLKQD
jgi:hypothetical protein